MKRILVVDDMAVFRRPMAAMIREMGYEPTCVKDGKEALEHISDNRVDLILLDLSMPRIDGFQFLTIRSGRSDLRKVPVVLLTALNDRKHLLRALKLGVQGCLLKSSFSAGELERKIEKALAKGSTPSTTVQRHQSDSAPAAASQRLSSPSREAVKADAEKRSSDRAKTQEPAPAQDGVSDQVAESSSQEEAEQSEAQTWEEFAPTLEPAIAPSELEETLTRDSEEFATISPGLILAMRVCQDPESTIESVIKAIRVDHQLSLKIIKMANSAGFSRGDRVTTLREAVLRIGIKRLSMTIRNLGMIESLFERDYGDLLHAGPFWEHSLTVAVAMAEIGEIFDAPDPDLLFTVGLLHDVGRLALHIRLPEIADRIIDISSDYGVPCEVVERILLGQDHGQLLQPLLPAWGYDFSLSQAISHQHAHDETPSAQSVRQATEWLRIADGLAHALMMGSSGNDFLRSLDGLPEQLGIGEERLQDLIGDIEEKAIDLKLVFLSQNAKISWEQQSKRIGTLVDRLPKPQIIGEQDPGRFHLWLRSLRQGVIEEDHDTALVVAVDRPQKAIDLAAKKLAMQEKDGDRHLPVIIIAPRGHFLTWPGNARAVHVLRDPPAPADLVRLLADAAEEQQAAQ